MLLTPTYEATATVLIVPPAYQTSIEPKPLALETYRDLALTPSLAERVVEALALTDQEGEPLPPRTLLDHFHVRVSAPQPDGKEGPQLAGVLHLDVSWDDPGKARDIANAWAQAFVEAATSIRRSEVDEVAGVILRQFAATDRALQQAEDQLLDFQEPAHLPAARQRVELLEAQLRDERAGVLALERELQAKADRLEILSRHVATLQGPDGEWVGLSPQAPDLTKAGTPPARVEAVQAALRYRAAREALDRFEEAAQITSLERALEQERQRLSSYREALASLQAEEPQLSARRTLLARSLSSQDPKLVLERSIPDTALWLTMVNNPATASQVGEVRLRDEQPNPSYEYVERKLIDTEVELLAIPNRVAALQALIENSEERVRNLDGELRALVQQRRLLQDRLALAQAVYEGLREQYRSLQQERATLVSEVDRLRAQLAAAKKALQAREMVFRAATAEFLQLTLQQERLARSVQMTRRTYDALSTQAETARLTELTTTGDVRFVSPAVAPTAPSSPRYVLNVAVATVLAMFAGVVIVFLLNTLRQGQGPSPVGEGRPEG